MSRIIRKNLNSLYLHTMVQGINKEKIFLDNYLKSIYLKYLNNAAKENDVKILVYAVMDNHAHFLIYYKKIEDVSKVMNIVNGKFAKLYNKKNNRVGYVFRDRFKCKPIQNLNQLYNTISYIHNNPVKAGVCKNPEDYFFSSYNDFIQNKKNVEDIKILFQTLDYKNIFFAIHKKYDYIDVLKEEGEEDYNQVIGEFLNLCKKDGINTLKEITLNNKLLISLVIQLREKANLKDTEITKILNIGKNRIYQILNKKN